MKSNGSTINPLKILVLLFALLNVTLFVGACYVSLLSTSIWMKVMSIAYMVLLILFLFFRNSRVVQKVKVVEKKVVVPGKKVLVKEYTGSDYRKIFHKRSCRFADSIKEENLEESDDKSYFTKKKYKPCGLCNPNK